MTSINENRGGERVCELHGNLNGIFIIFIILYIILVSFFTIDIPLNIDYILLIH